MSAQQTVPASMRAWSHTSRGPPSKVLKLTTEPVPKLRTPSSILVRVSYASLNIGPTLLMHTIPFALRSKVSIAELDFAGTVILIGEGTPDKFKQTHVPGAQVFGSVPVSAHLRFGVGSLAEYVAVEAADVAVLPWNISPKEAAGLAVAGATAVEVFEKAKLQKGMKVLVNGASGGIGSIVVQLAKDAVGETGVVLGICSSRNSEMVEELGADEIIEYNSHQPISKHVSLQHSNPRFDAILDCRGVQDLYSNCSSYLTQKGPFVSVGPQIAKYTWGAMLFSLVQMAKNFFLSVWPTSLGGTGRQYIQAASFVDQKVLHKLAEMVGDERFSVVAKDSFKMDDALKAYEILLNGRARGKIVIKVET